MSLPCARPDWLSAPATTDACELATEDIAAVTSAEVCLVVCRTQRREVYLVVHGVEARSDVLPRSRVARSRDYGTSEYVRLRYCTFT